MEGAGTAGGRTHHHQILTTQGVVDDRVVFEGIEGVGLGPAINEKAEELAFGVQPAVLTPDREHGVGADAVAVVDGVGLPFGAIFFGAVNAGVDVEDSGSGVFREPLSPGGDGDGKDFQFDAAPGQRPQGGSADELVPKGVGLTIIHQLIAAVEHTGGAEFYRFAVDVGGIHDSGTAEGSIGQGEGDATNHVVSHFMGVENTVGVGAVLAVEGDAEDPLDVV